MNSYRPCATCGQDFPRHHHGNERYCSPRCRAAAKTGWRGQVYPGQYVSKTEINAEYGKERRIMSGVLWCDKGEHPFSVKDINKQHFVNTHTEPVLTGNSYGNPTYQQREQVTEEIDICGPHWLSDNPFTTPETPAIDAAEAEAEQSAAEMWEAKYQAEHAEKLRLQRKLKD